MSRKFILKAIVIFLIIFASIAYFNKSQDYISPVTENLTDNPNLQLDVGWFETTYYPVTVHTSNITFIVRA